MLVGTCGASGSSDHRGLPFPMADCAPSVVVVSHNEGDELRATLVALRATSPVGTEIVVVDDASTDGSADALEPSGMLIARAPERLGVSAARNLGARLTTRDVIVWADAHIAPARGWFESFAPLLARREVGAVGPAVSILGKTEIRGFGMHWTSERLDIAWLPRPPAGQTAVPMLGGFCLAMRRDVFERSGGFDEGLILWGGDDAEMCFRLWTLGLECHVVAATVVGHLFRTRFPYSVPSATVLHNLLRIAIVHFGVDRLARVIEGQRAEPAFPQAMAMLGAGDAFRRREELRRIRARSDDEIFARFPLAAQSHPEPGATPNAAYGYPWTIQVDALLPWNGSSQFTR